MAARHRNTSLGESIDLCKKALDHNPEFGLAYYQLGDDCSEQVNRSDAIAAYEKAAYYLPIVLDIRQKLAAAYKEAGRTDDAEKTLRQTRDILKRIGFPAE
jgi:tetratricopeptide (TPR) repeat protein